jgi:hypothetical protein
MENSFLRATRNVSLWTIRFAGEPSTSLAVPRPASAFRKRLPGSKREPDSVLHKSPGVVKRLTPRRYASH